MQQINNENCAKFVHSEVYTFIDEIQTYIKINVTLIFHFPINVCVKNVFSA
jgi:hypothetical protein